MNPPATTDLPPVETPQPEKRSMRRTEVIYAVFVFAVAIMLFATAF